MKWFRKKKKGSGKPDKAYLDARKGMMEKKAAGQKAAIEKANKGVEAKKAGAKAAKKGNLASGFEPGEFERAKAMAKEAMAWRPFIEACKKHRVQKPGLAFLRWYADIKGNPDLWKVEARAEESIEEKGRRFNRTGFYAQLFIDFLERKSRDKGKERQTMG